MSGLPPASNIIYPVVSNPILAAILFVIGTVVVAIIRFLGTRTQSTVDDRRTTLEAMNSLITSLQTRVGMLDNIVRVHEATIVALHAKLDADELVIQDLKIIVTTKEARITALELAAGMGRGQDQ